MSNHNFKILKLNILKQWFLNFSVRQIQYEKSIVLTPNPGVSNLRPAKEFLIR